MKKTVFCLLLALTLLLTLSVPALGKAAPAGGATWSVPGSFATIQEAIDSAAVAGGDTIVVGPGHFAGAYVNKKVTIRGLGQTVIDTGPLHPAGLVMGFRFLAGSDGSSLSNLDFSVDLAVMNGDGVDGVTIDHCAFTDAIQAISNWRGSGWTITHNTITDLRTSNGGGIGILIGDYSNGRVTGNTVTHNAISGTLHVSPADGGGYNGSGIVLYADYRWGRLGTAAISGNDISHNAIALTSDTPAVVDVVAFEITDTRDDAALAPVIFDNVVMFNDFRGTALQIAVTPDGLAEANVISRNLGENRGHGAHPVGLN
jgi:hypothetical protein